MRKKKDIVFLFLITFISVLTFVYLVIKIGKIGIGEYKTYYIIFDNTKGLPEKADVRLGGLKVGYVERMRVLLDKSDIKIETEIKVRKDIPIRKDFEAQIRMKSLLGEKYIELLPTGEGDISEAPEGFKITRTKTLFEPDELLMSLKPFIDTMNPQMIKEMTNALTSLVNTTEPLILNVSYLVKNLSDITPEIKELTEKLYKSSDDIQKIIEIFSKNSEAINQSLKDLPQLINNVNSVLSGVSNTLYDGNQLISNLVQYQDSITSTTIMLPELISNLVYLTKSANTMLPEFQKILTQTTQTLEKLQEVLEKGVKVRLF